MILQVAVKHSKGVLPYISLWVDAVLPDLKSCLTESKYVYKATIKCVSQKKSSLAAGDNAYSRAVVIKLQSSKRSSYG